MIAGKQLAVLVFIAATSAGRVPAATTILQIQNTIVQKSVKRFGINLGMPNYYDSGQMLKNLLFRNPGFEGEIRQSLIRCATAAANTCTDDDAWSAWPVDFWRGAAYEFIWGSAQGHKGLVTNSTAARNGTGIVLTFDRGGARIAAGDYLVVRMTRKGGAQAGWWPHVTGVATIGTELADLPPQTAGQQAVSLLAPGDSRATLAGYFDTTANRTFVQLRGNYRLRFRAKGKLGNNRLQVSLARKRLRSAHT